MSPMSTATCLDPQARLCLLRHLYALKHGQDDRPCRDCEPAAQVAQALRATPPPRRGRPPKPVTLPAPELPAEPPAPKRGRPPKTAPDPAPIPAAKPEPTPASTPAPAQGLDRAALRAALKPFVHRQARTGQRSVFVERLQAEYNATLPKAARLKGKRHFREALAAVPGLTLQGQWLTLDDGARALCRMPSGGQE